MAHSYDVPTAMFVNNWEAAEGIAGMWEAADGNDNRWLISALNIVAANRGQLDRVFFGELDDTWIEKGFFTCKFYRDDPNSDDDWQASTCNRHRYCHSRPYPHPRRYPHGHACHRGRHSSRHCGRHCGCHRDPWPWPRLLP